MTRILLGAAIALAACSSEPQRNAAAPAAPAANAGDTVAPPPAAAPAAAVDGGVRPQPGALRTFGDWTVGCDNTRRCELRSLGPDLAAPGGATVSVARDAGPDGRFSLSAGTDAGDAASAEVEGASDARTPAALAAAMADGRRMIARVAGKALTVSLRGASAALRYVDAVQGRAGTVTATVARGPKPASAVPAAMPAPVIVAVAPGGAPATASASQLAAMREAAGCDGSASGDPEFHTLGGGRTLVLLPCSSGAYNLIQALFVLDGDRFVAATADAPVGFAETGADGPNVPGVVNGAWKDGVLTSYAKGRGLGDCGVDQQMVWDGTRLRLSRQSAMGECRGNADYITTWRTRVVRR